MLELTTLELSCQALYFAYSIAGWTNPTLKRQFYIEEMIMSDTDVENQLCLTNTKLNKQIALQPFWDTRNSPFLMYRRVPIPGTTLKKY